jgi:hypothetical protein
VEQGLMRPVLQQQTGRVVSFDVIVPNRKRLPLLTRTILEELKPGSRRDGQTAREGTLAGGDRA